MRDIETCRTLDPIDDFTPVESRIPGSWFAVKFLTGESFRIGDLDPEVAVQVRRAIDASDIPEAEPTLADEFVDEGRFDKHLMKAIFVVGAGGSGKSSIADAMFGGTGLKVINADKHLERFLRELEIPPREVGKHYGLFRQAREMMKKEFKHYSHQRLGLIVDSTGWDYQRVANPAQRLRALGYDLFMVVVRVPLEVAISRNRARAEKGGRFVPDSFVEDAWYGLEKNLKRYTRFFGPKNMHIIENDTEIEDVDWVSIVKPKLHAIGQKILARPLKNKVGQNWLKRQMKAEESARRVDGQEEGEAGEVLGHPPHASASPPPSKLRAALEAVTLPARARNVKHAIALAQIKAREHGLLYVVPEGRTFEVREYPGTPAYFIEVDPDHGVVYRREADGVLVQTNTLWEVNGALVEGPPEDFLPIPLEERHWRDNPKDFRNRYQITPEKKRDDVGVCTIGKSVKNGKWYGWSHRAMSGFSRGDRAFPKLHGKHIDWDWDKREKWEKEQIAAAPKIKTDAEAKQSAVNFADWVS
jgi:predicted ABC-type ATPase